MENEITTTTLPPEGVTPESVSQLTPPPEQSDATPKPEAVVKVETPEPKAPSTPGRKETLRPSEHYRIRNLEKKFESTIAEMQKSLSEQIASLQSSQKVSTKPSDPKSSFKDKFYVDPIDSTVHLVDERAKTIASEVVQEMIDKQNQESAKKARLSDLQEAKKLLDAHPSGKDPAFIETLNQIGDEAGVNRWIDDDPLGGVKTLLGLYDKLKQEKPKIELAPKKEHLAPVVSGTPPGAQKPVLKDAINKMALELQNDPTLARNPEWLSKWDKIKKAA